MDQVDGFKLFLGAVDGDRLNRVVPPDKTPETFEKFLPYALALDLEQAWSEKFAGELGAAAKAPSNGEATLLRSTPAQTGTALPPPAFPGGFASAFSDAVSSSSSAPGSSSGSDGRRGRRRLVNSIARPARSPVTIFPGCVSVFTWSPRGLLLPFPSRIRSFSWDHGSESGQFA